jgi:hypothetical protein
MTEPDGLPIADPVSDRPAPSEPDSSYGYALPGRRLAQVVAGSIVLAIVAVIALFVPQAKPAIVALCLSLVPLMAVALVAAVLLVPAGKDRVPMAPLLFGWAVVLGGAACDIYATVSHDPNLVWEANPVIRGLLDNGMTLQDVYVYGAVQQAVFVGLTLVLWLGFLKHRRTLAATLPPRGSLLAYFKAGTGGRELSYRQWLFPLTYAELPWAYHLTWWIGVGFVGIATYRYYLALEWYRVVPVSPLWVRFIAPSVVFFLTCRWYAVWLRSARARLAGEAPKEPAAGIVTSSLPAP